MSLNAILEQAIDLGDDLRDPLLLAELDVDNLCIDCRAVSRAFLLRLLAEDEQSCSIPPQRKKCQYRNQPNHLEAFQTKIPTRLPKATKILYTASLSSSS